MLIDDFLADQERLVSFIDRAPNPAERRRRFSFAFGDREADDETIDFAMEQEVMTISFLRRAQCFVLSPLTIETAAELAAYQTKQLRDHAQYLHLPAMTTWIDLTAQHVEGAPPGRCGVLFVGGDNILAGDAMIVTDGPDGYRQMSGRFDLARGVLWKAIGDATVNAWRQAGGDPERMIATVWAAIALINTPRLTTQQSVDLSKLNKARARNRKPPMIQYRQVQIHIDRGQVGATVARNETGEGVALHHVRAFLRLKRGKVELVRPHWRGNPRFGVVIQRYVALRAEDEAGPWMGGPMPPNRSLDRKGTAE